MFVFFWVLFLGFTGDDNSALDESDGECGDDREPRPSCADYVMHFLTLFWKILFAFIPPTGNSCGNLPECHQLRVCDGGLIPINCTRPLSDVCFHEQSE